MAGNSGALECLTNWRKVCIIARTHSHTHTHSHTFTRTHTHIYTHGPQTHTKVALNDLRGENYFATCSQTLLIKLNCWPRRLISDHVHLCMCVRVCVCVCVCVWVCVCVDVCNCARGVCVCVEWVWMWAWVCVNVCVSVWLCVWSMCQCVFGCVSVSFGRSEKLEERKKTQDPTVTYKLKGHFSPELKKSPGSADTQKRKLSTDLTFMSACPIEIKQYEVTLLYNNLYLSEVGK